MFEGYHGNYNYLKVWDQPASKTVYLICSLCVRPVRIKYNKLYCHVPVFTYVTTGVDMFDPVGLFDVFCDYGGIVVAFSEVTCFSNLLYWASKPTADEINAIVYATRRVS